MPIIHKSHNTSTNDEQSSNSDCDMGNNDIEYSSIATTSNDSSDSETTSTTKPIKQINTVSIDAIDKYLHKSNNNNKPTNNEITITHVSPSTQSQQHTLDPTTLVVKASATTTTRTVTISKPLPPLSQKDMLSTQRISSVIHHLYNIDDDERGHATIGHVCISSNDKFLAQQCNSDLLYGEILPIGVSRALDEQHLNAYNACVLYDLGSGCGKLAIQAFLQFSNLQYVCGIELSQSRSHKAFDALQRLNCKYGKPILQQQQYSHNNQTNMLRMNIFNSDVLTNQQNNNEYIVDDTISSNESKEAYTDNSYNTKHIFQRHGSNGIRTLELINGNMFDVINNIHRADIIICETKIPESNYINLCQLINHCKIGCRILTYEDLDNVWNNKLHNNIEHDNDDILHMIGQYPLQQLPINISQNDRFETSWSVNNGAHFYLYKKVR